VVPLRASLIRRHADYCGIQIDFKVGEYESYVLHQHVLNFFVGREFLYVLRNDKGIPVVTLVDVCLNDAVKEFGSCPHKHPMLVFKDVLGTHFKELANSDWRMGHD